ncbi:MAG: hypothetical protein JKY96_04550 [Phycisphaerales bacterium]|nr:hypothetical protein [Phycisphaerales bacterium]
MEYDLGTGVLKGLPFEPIKIPYSVKTTYTPDFVNEEKKILFEAKGRFSDQAEASKYIHFRHCNPDYEIIFIFEKPNCPFPFAKKRKKCGTKRTHAEWAEGNGFRYCCPKTIDEDWL